MPLDPSFQALLTQAAAQAQSTSREPAAIVAMEIVPFQATADFGVVRLRLDARETPAAIIKELKSLIGEFPGDAPVLLEVRTSEGPKTLRFGPEFKVRPDGDFFAEAKALLGDAALIA